MLDIVAKSDSKYGGMFLVKCKKCHQETKNVFNREDRMVLRFQATCEKCGESGEFRFNGERWDGLRS